VKRFAYRPHDLLANYLPMIRAGLKGQIQARHRIISFFEQIRTLSHCGNNIATVAGTLPPWASQQKHRSNCDQTRTQAPAAEAATFLRVDISPEWTFAGHCVRAECKELRPEMRLREIACPQGSPSAVLEQVDLSDSDIRNRSKRHSIWCDF
jgi:hypothetical protein